MSPLKERLRSPSEPTVPYTSLADLCREALDEIERLERELDEAVRVPIDAILRLIEPQLERPQEQ